MCSCNLYVHLPDVFAVTADLDCKEDPRANKLLGNELFPDNRKIIELFKPQGDG